MPSKRRKYDDALQYAPWIENLDSICLREVVVEALISRRHAIESGASPKAIEPGDKTLEQIELGRYVGDKACRKASVALRKFDEAYVTPNRRGHSRMKRRKMKRKV